MNVPKRVKEMVADILAREGGYVDDPTDKGGTTKHGISLRYAEGLGLDLDGDGNTDSNDIRLVTPEIASELYIEDFYTKPKIHRLPGWLQAQMFDIAVNSGPFRAYELLQIAINTFLPTGTKIFEDGRWGPKSRAALDTALDTRGVSWSDISNALVVQRKHYYTCIVSRDHSQKRFLKGWYNRADEFLV